MKQSTCEKVGPAALHVAIIMDGNGRWARARGLPRLEGHQAGAAAVERVVEASPDLGIGTLTLYAFSSDNWKRPPREVGGLLGLFGEYLARHAAHCREHGVRVQVIGRRGRLPRELLDSIAWAEATTLGGGRLHLRIAIDYSARHACLEAAAKLAGMGPVRESDFVRATAAAIHADERTPDVDLLIRTGGELRLSDLLGWDSAYAELLFTNVMWPDFQGADLAAAVKEFWSRERRFGGLPVAPGLVEPSRNGSVGALTPETTIGQK